MTDYEAPDCYSCEYFPDCRIIEIALRHTHDIATVLQLDGESCTKFNTAFAREIANYCNRYKETTKT